MMFCYDKLVRKKLELDECSDYKKALLEQLEELNAREKKSTDELTDILNDEKLTVENVSLNRAAAGSKFGVKVLDPRDRNRSNNWNGDNIYFPAFTISKYGYHRANYLANLTRDYFLIMLGHKSDIWDKEIPDFEIIRRHVDSYIVDENVNGAIPTEVLEKINELSRRVALYHRSIAVTIIV